MKYLEIFQKILNSMQYDNFNIMVSTDFSHFTGHSKAASLSNHNEAGWHIDISFGHHQYSTFIYNY